MNEPQLDPKKPPMVPGTYWDDESRTYVTPYDAHWSAATAEQLADYKSGEQRIEAQRIYAREDAVRTGAPTAGMSDAELEEYARKEHAPVLAAREAEGGSVGAHGDAGMSMVLSELRAIRMQSQQQTAMLEAFTETLPEEQRKQIAEAMRAQADKLLEAPDEPDEAEDE